MVRASYRSSSGCGLDPRLGLRNRFSEDRAWRSFIDHFKISPSSRSSKILTSLLTFFGKRFPLKLKLCLRFVWSTSPNYHKVLLIRINKVNADYPWEFASWFVATFLHIFVYWPVLIVIRFSRGRWLAPIRIPQGNVPWHEKLQSKALEIAAEWQVFHGSVSYFYHYVELRRKWKQFCVDKKQDSCHACLNSSGMLLGEG